MQLGRVLFVNIGGSDVVSGSSSFFSLKKKVQNLKYNSCMLDLILTFVASQRDVSKASSDGTLHQAVNDGNKVITK